MKKILCILVGLATFLTGVGFRYLKEFTVFSERTIQNIHFDETKQPRLKAILAVGGYYDVIDSSVRVIHHKNGYPLEDSIEITKEIENSKNFFTLKKQLIEERNDTRNRSRDGWAVVEVELVGEFVSEDNKITNAQNLKLKPIKINQLSNIRFVSPSEVSYLDKYLY